MFGSIEDLEKIIKEKSIRHLDFKFTDFAGRWHHITVPASRAGENLFAQGVGFDGSNFPGLKSLESGDLSLVPDLSTAFIDPFRTEPAVSFICDIVESDTKKPFNRDPRAVAEKAENYLASTGKADRSWWGPEFEYHIFDQVYVDNSPLRSGYEILPGEGQFEGLPGLAPSGGYHAIPPEDISADLRDRTVSLLEDAGVELIYHHHEVGGHGQVEIEVQFGPLTRMADVVMMVKYFARMAAHTAGRQATFMPKPIFGEPGNGMHFHQHLFKGDDPVFFDREGYAGLSKLALQYISGLLIHSPALLAITNPSTNSYKRLVPGYEAPVHSFFSLANRSAAIRIPKYAVDPEKKRIEFRPPDATCNPYFCMAAQLMAGIDGIINELDPEQLGLGPYDINIFDLEPDQRGKIRELPASLQEALDALKEDHEFLTRGDVFSEEMIEEWIQIKHDHEVSPVEERTHPYEYRLYFDC
ncbi:MAG: type I glutamate--ammonia ligase [Candidatus Latescibacteria bacterium]|nr:type I glutamate--ammonia ligase [bacterium]MBD3423156.1 type I glutamate--ammonia ligase [Candidatus Latescibacterota bacterium]